ncbi:MAG TPA: SIMPL domain-containing protein, partial [Povalibacter sp.]|nr:SIMPL domain-containing protein [Povalibacter sp.]
MNQKLRFSLPVLLGAALCLSATSFAAETERPRIVAVSGQGEVQAEPDQAIVTLGVESRKPRLEDARAEVA